MSSSVTSSTGVTVTQQEAQAYRKAHGNEATYKFAKENGFTNAQIAQALGVKKSDVDAYARQSTQQSTQQKLDTIVDKVNQTTGQAVSSAVGGAVSGRDSQAGIQRSQTYSAKQSEPSVQSSKSISVTSSTGVTVTQQEAQAYWKAHGNEATYKFAKENGFTNAQIAQALEVKKSDVDGYEEGVRDAQRIDEIENRIKNNSLTREQLEAALGLRETARHSPVSRANQTYSTDHSISTSTRGADGEFSVTGSSGQTVTRSEAQAFAKTHTPAEVFREGQKRGLSNEQMAQLFDLEKADIDAFEETLQINGGYSGRVGNRVEITTPNGLVISDAAAKAYLNEHGEALTYFRGKTLGLTNAQIGQLLDIDKAHVDAYEAALDAQGVGPNSLVPNLDVAFPVPQNTEELDKQALSYHLWLKPWNDQVSAQDIQAGLQTLVDRHNEKKQLFPSEAARLDDEFPMELIQELLDQGIPVSQFLDAVKEIPQLSGDKVHQYFADLGLPSPQTWHSSVQGATIPNIKAVLSQHGLTGSGVGVRVLEPDVSAHADMVGSIVNDPDFGLAPGAHVSLHVLDTPTDSAEGSAPISLAHSLVEAISAYTGQMIQEQADEVGPMPPLEILYRDAAAQAISSAMAGYLDDVMQEVHAFTDSDDRILNMSFGNSLMGLGTDFYGAMQKIMQVNPELARGIFGQNVPRNQQEYNQGVIDFVVQAIEGGGHLAESFERYAAAAKAAAEKGKVIVVGAANDQSKVNNLLADGYDISPFAGFNYFAASEHVIAVGASDTRGTPVDVSDDTMADFSSHGPVTVTAQGVHSAVPYGVFATLGDAGGTSAAAPQVTATVALMLQKNPNLTFEQVKQILKDTAIDTSAPNYAEGAGMLDIFGAVAAA